MTDTDASEATITSDGSQRYYAEMGGGGAPPDILLAPARAGPPTTSPPSAVRLSPKQSAAAYPPSGTGTKPRLPVALIFICLVVVYVGIRYFWR